MKNRRNYYRILQVQPDAPVEVIRAGYRALMRELKNHPDLGGSTSEASLLNEAYETLSNPERRAAYDKKIKANRFRRTASASAPNNAPGDAAFCPFCKTPLSPAAQAGKTCPTCNVPLPSSKQTNRGGESRRRIGRMKKSERIVYSSSWPEVPKKGTMIDLSPRGMRFICAEKLADGTVLKINAPGLKACGVVTNQKQEREEDGRYYAIGVSFTSVLFDDSRGAFFSASA